MALNQWFKFYGGEFLSDPKIASLTASERSCWVTLLCLASISSTPGVVKYLTTEILLEKAGVSVTEVTKSNGACNKNVLDVLNRFQKMEMITVNSAGDIILNNWEKRQETALTNAERQARYREKHSNEKVTAPVTNVTLDKIRLDKSINTLTPPTKVEDVSYEPINDEGERVVKYKGLKKPVAVSPLPFDFKSELERLSASPAQSHNIAAHYFTFKGITLENEAQYYPALARTLKVAKQLSGYNGDQIQDAFEYCEKEWPGIWTLETVVKRLPEIISKK